MTKQIIVKDNWLSFLHLPALATRRLQVLIISGHSFDPEDLRKKFGAKLSDEKISYVQEKTFQVLGRLRELSEFLQGLETKEPLELERKALWQERVFLKAFALSRSGSFAEAERWFAKLPRHFQPRIDTEYALQFLNRGDFIRAENLFKEALDHHSEIHDLYSLCTLLGGLSLALIQQGKFREADVNIKTRRRLLKTAPSPSLHFGTRLYEMLLLLEKNDFHEADQLLRTALDEQDQGSINGFFLLHLKLRLHLARNELSNAQEVLQDLKRTISQQQIPDGVLDIRLEEVEWNLRSQKSLVALELISLLERNLSSPTNFYFQFRLSLLRAQALYQANRPQEAFQEISAGIALGERHSYLPGLSWALFHGAGIAQAAGHPVQAKIYLQKGERLASQLGLRVRFACFSYMAEVMSTRKSNGESLLSLVRHQEINPEMEYYLDSYSLLRNVDLGVISRNGREVIHEPEMRQRLFQEPGHFWFQKEEVLLSNLGPGKMQLAHFAPKPTLLAAFRLFWNAFQYNDEGFTLKDVHQTRLSCTYREELHASATKMLITRLRHHLARNGLQLHYNRETGFYSLRSALPPYTLARSDQERGTAVEQDRLEQILTRIAQEAFVSTRSLCQEFSVSRQALHPFLKKLIATKKIRLVRRGPVSGYIFLGKG